MAHLSCSGLVAASRTQLLVCPQSHPRTGPGVLGLNAQHPDLHQRVTMVRTASCSGGDDLGECFAPGAAEAVTALPTTLPVPMNHDIWYIGLPNQLQMITAR